MTTLVVVCRFVIALILVSAALGKMLDLAKFRSTVEAFGVRPDWARRLGIAIPLLELTAGALLAVAGQWWSAVPSALLFASFGVVIATNLFLGRKPDCNCFGPVHSAPIGLHTLALNVLLLAGAVLVAARSGDAQFAWPEATGIAWAAAIGAVAAATAGTAWFALQLYKQNGRLLDRIELLEARVSGEVKVALPSAAAAEPSKPGLPIGAEAPDFELDLVSGGRHSLRDLIARQKPVLLMFMDPNCGPCSAMLPDIARWTAELRDLATVAIISRGSREANLAKASGHTVGEVLLQQEYEVSNAFLCFGTPGAVLIDAQGRIASAVAQGADRIGALVQTARETAASADRQVKAASTLAFKDLAGHPVTLSSFRGRKLLTIFWNPACGFCARMLEQLLTSDHSSPDLELLFVSQGGAEENRRLAGLRATVVLDDSFEAGRVFGAAGTPSAILLDETGRPASSVAVGADRIFALLDNTEDVPGRLRALASASG